MFLTFNNFVLTCGNNKYGQCARPLEAKNEMAKFEGEVDVATEEDVLEDSYSVGLSAFNIENHTVYYS